MNKSLHAGLPEYGNSKTCESCYSVALKVGERYVVDRETTGTTSSQSIPIAGIFVPILRWNKAKGV